MKSLKEHSDKLREMVYERCIGCRVGLPRTDDLRRYHTCHGDIEKMQAALLEVLEEIFGTGWAERLESLPPYDRAAIEERALVIRAEILALTEVK